MQEENEQCSDEGVSWAFSEQFLSLVLHQGRQSKCGNTPLLGSEALEVVNTLCFSPWLLLLYIPQVFFVPPILGAATLETGRCGGKIAVCAS